MRRPRRHGNRYHDNGPLPECPVCHKPVRDLKTSIQHKLTNTPAHFDCIIKDIQKTETLEASEKLCYLGRGTFGILSFRNASSPLRFIIRKRIKYEEKEQSLDWPRP